MENTIVRKLAGAAVCALVTLNCYALDVNITPNLPELKTTQNNKVVKIQRIQDQSHTLTGAYTKTSRKCPPFCIQPMTAAEGVTTVGELEVLDFIKQKVNTGRGVLIDARTPSWNKKGTIPGSVNIPFTTFDPKQDRVVLGATLGNLGVSRKGDESMFEGLWNSVVSIADASTVTSRSWDFSNAKDILLWCNGMWCGQSPTAIKNLIALGYPPEKISYYRGGMQAWQSLGLTVVIPE